MEMGEKKKRPKKESPRYVVVKGERTNNQQQCSLSGGARFCVCDEDHGSYSLPRAAGWSLVDQGLSVGYSGSNPSRYHRPESVSSRCF